MATGTLVPHGTRTDAPAVLDAAASAAAALASEIAAAASAATADAHIADLANPHATTATHVGLGNADNTSDANKPVSTAQQTALDLKANLTTSVQKTSNTGSAELPAGTTAQRDGAPVVGMVRWNSTLTRYEGWDGAAWSALGGGATGGSSDAVFHENDQTVTADYTITAGKNAVSAGAITINTGVTVTVPTGARWVIV